MREECRSSNAEIRRDDEGKDPKSSSPELKRRILRISRFGLLSSFAIQVSAFLALPALSVRGCLLRASWKLTPPCAAFFLARASTWHSHLAPLNFRDEGGEFLPPLPFRT